MLSRICTNLFAKLHFCRQIDRDCEFLETERIMDYSLLVGLHFRDVSTGDKIGLSPFLLRKGKFMCSRLALPLSLTIRLGGIKIITNLLALQE